MEINSQLRDFLDNVNDLIQIIKPDLTIMFVNRSWKETLGYNDDEIEQMKFTDVIHPDEREHCIGIFGEVINGEAVGLIRTKFITKDNQIIEVQGNVNCQFEGGKPVYTRGIFRDITEQIETEQRLRLQEEHFKALTENAFDMICELDERGIFHYISPNLIEFIGLDSDTLTNKSFIRFVHPDDRRELLIKYQKGIREFLANLHQFRIKRADGSWRWIESTGKPFHTLTGKLRGVIISRDITDRRLLEEERNRFIRQLEDALGKIKILKGLIPICSSCKKIRDDSGYWGQVEEYITEHSEAEFSHGLCPGCAKELYPDVFEKGSRRDEDSGDSTDQ